MENAEDSAVADFLQILEEHRRNCERQGKYVEAEIAKNRLDELKVICQQHNSKCLNDFQDRFNNPIFPGSRGEQAKGGHEEPPACGEVGSRGSAHARVRAFKNAPAFLARVRVLPRP